MGSLKLCRSDRWILPTTTSDLASMLPTGILSTMTASISVVAPAPTSSAAASSSSSSSSSKSAPSGGHACKDMVHNESMDSGIAGVRDAPHGGSPTSAASSGSSSSNTNLSAPLHHHHHHNNNAGERHRGERHDVADAGSKRQEFAELPQYIVDRSTRTTYLKGKFLGKVGDNYPVLHIFTCFAYFGSGLDFLPS